MKTPPRYSWLPDLYSHAPRRLTWRGNITELMPSYAGRGSQYIMSSIERTPGLPDWLNENGYKWNINVIDIPTDEELVMFLLAWG